MKNLLLIIPFLVIFSDCSKNIDYKSIGYIQGEDFTKCACCGGTIIEIEGVSYRYWEENESFDIHLDTENLPLKVFLNWHKKEKQCYENGNLIIVEDMKVLK